MSILLLSVIFYSLPAGNHVLKNTVVINDIVSHHSVIRYCDFSISVVLKRVELVNLSEKCGLLIRFEISRKNYVN